jgi:hypothetical protein
MCLTSILTLECCHFGLDNSKQRPSMGSWFVMMGFESTYLFCNSSLVETTSYYFMDCQDV